jgi:hypothetical protein
VEDEYACRELVGWKLWNVVSVLKNVEDAFEGVPGRCNTEASCRVEVVRYWLAHCVEVEAHFLVAYETE